MRFYLLLLSCLFCLTSCIHYAGIKPTARPYRAADLSVPHHYPEAAKLTSRCPVNWWNKFHDPDLNQLIAVVLADSPTLQTAEARVRRAFHIANSAGSALWPKLSFGGGVAQERFTANSIIPPPYAGSVENEGLIGLRFKYEFDWWGKNREALAARLNETRAKEAEFAEAKLILTTSIAHHYFQLQSQLAQLKIAEAILKQRNELLKVTTTKTRHEIESDIPVSAAAADAQAADLTVHRARLAVAISEHQLAELMGKNPLNTTIHVRPFHYHAQQLALPANIPANLLAQRPDICASRWRAEAAAHQINAAKARFFPNLNLNSYLAYQSIGLNRLFWTDSRDNAVQAAIDLPIFDANQRRADLKTRDDEFDIAVSEYNETILTGLREVADQLTTLHYVNQEQQTQTNLLKATEHNFALIQSRYKNGIVDYTQVLKIQGTLLNQQRIQIQLQAKHMLALVAMIKALGGDYVVEGKI